MAVKFYLDKRLSKQGEAPIRCSITIQGQRCLTTTGHSIAPKCWDNDSQKVQLTYSGKPVVNAKGVKAKVINAYLKRIDSYFSDLETELLNSGATAGDIKSIFKTEFGKTCRNNVDEEPEGFYGYFDEFTKEMGKQNDWTPATHEKFHALKNHIQDFSEDVSFETLKAICEAVSIPVIAIGGITKENIQELAGSGICGIAVISAIFAQNDIRAAADDLRTATLTMVEA